MNDKLSNAMADILKSSKDGVINIALFAQQQAPELAKEIVQWGFWSNFMWFFISGGILFILFRIHKILLKININDEGNPGSVIGWLIGGIIAIIFICMMFGSLESCLKTMISPKLYLIDYINNLIKPSSK